MKIKSFRTFTLSFLAIAFCGLFSSFTVFAQDDPCVPLYRISNCGDDVECEVREQRESDAAIAKCRAERNQKANKSKTTPTSPTTNPSSAEAKIRADAEVRKRAKLEEEERARERTRAYNEQQERLKNRCPPGVTCVGRAEISDTDANADERTRAFNAQKRQQNASTVQPSTNPTAQTRTSNAVRRKPSKPKPRRNGRKKPR